MKPILLEYQIDIGKLNMKIEKDKIDHFFAGIMGWMYFRYIRVYPEELSHLIIFILGGLWELYWWKIKRKDPFCFVDWFFVCFGAFAIHSIALTSWIHSPIGYLIVLYMLYRLTKLW